MLLGVDVGGTAVKLGLVDAHGGLHARAEYAVGHDGYQTPLFQSVTEAMRRFLADVDVRVEGVGISTTGQIDVVEGLVAGSCGNIPGWVGTPVRAGLEARFGVPVSVMNDANCAVLGERWMGGARGVDDVVMVTLGTGVGCGVITGGQVLSGSRGFAGEGGHFPIHVGGRLCTCGMRGCYEQYASVTGLLAQACALRPEETLDGRRVFALAAEGDAAMQALLVGWIEDIVAGLAGLVHLFNPRVVLIGGGVSAQEALLIAPIRQALLAAVMPRYGEGLQVQAAMLGNDAGILGAARHWLDRYRGTCETD